MLTSKSKLLRLLAVLFALTLVAAACGSDDDGGDVVTDEEAPAEEDAPAEEEAPEEEEAPAEEEAPEEEAPAEEEEEAPAEEASGEPLRIGFQNPEGDPNGSFPEYSLAAQAAVDYINAERGGFGGRPGELVVCKMAISPDDSQRCANELVAEGVEVVVSSLNFFGNHFPIYQGAGIPVIVGTPITVGDFTSAGVYSVGAGGGCFGVHTGLIQFTTQVLPELEGIDVNRVGVPWADTPPGVVCYYDLESKPLDVIKGVIPGASALAGSNPDLEHIGVPVLPAAADLTPQATEVLEFEPDAIIFSAQGSDCWNLVDAMGRLGWTPQDIPLVLSGACIDFTAMEAAGELAEGIYLTSTENSVLTPLELAAPGQHTENAEIYQTKSREYGLPDDEVNKGFAGQGFSTMITIADIADGIAAGGGEVTGQSINDGFAATDGSEPAFGGSPLSCSTAPEPYVAVCSAPITITQWDGEALIPVNDGELVSGIDLVAGTELLPGPYETG